MLESGYGAYGYELLAWQEDVLGGRSCMYLNVSPNPYFNRQPEKSDCWQPLVSVHADGSLAGSVSFQVDPVTRSALNMAVARIGGEPIPASDILRVVDHIFVKLRLARLEFFVICGNPAEAAIDRLVEKAGGRILCVRRRTARLPDFTLADSKHYEILRDDYLAARGRRWRTGQ